MKFLPVFVSAALGVSLVGCSNSKSTSTSSPIPPAIPVPASVVGTQAGAYTISVFAQAPGTLVPDDLLQMSGSIFVVMQDPNINPDGTVKAGVNSAQSEVIEYDLNGNVLQTFKVPGHPDGE